MSDVSQLSRDDLLAAYETLVSERDGLVSERDGLEARLETVQGRSFLFGESRQLLWIFMQYNWAMCYKMVLNSAV